MEALKNVSFEVPKGKITVVVGPSGCGKSTLLRLLARVIKPTSGSIEFHWRHENPVGFVFQDPTLMPWRTVVGNIVLPIETDQPEKKGSTEKVGRLLKLLELEDCESLYPNQLSGGMKQKVAIARALIQDPEVLLMDEPFSALDETIRQKMNFELLRLKEKTGISGGFVTHNISEAVVLADYIIVLGIRPNTVRGKRLVRFQKRNQRLLSSPAFFKELVKVRKMVGTQ